MVMPAGQLEVVVDYIRKISTPDSGAYRTDSELLAQFAARGEDAAFAALVHRHGPMVLGVCRRVLRNLHEAEDAFQATFLVLARKAGSLSRPEMLSAWLNGVAYRIALRARSGLARRWAREQPLHDLPAAFDQDEDVYGELRSVLDEAVNRLPGKYRLPVILCYFEGKTNAEAARQLGCPERTVATRLARARHRLRTHLTRRGLGMSAALLTVELVRLAASAKASPALVRSTVQVGCAYAADPALLASMVPGKVLALTEGALHAMSIRRLTIFLFLFLATGTICTGTHWLVYPAPAAENRVQAEAIQPPTNTRLEDPPESVVTFRTANFQVTAPTEDIANQILAAAERHRKAQALRWLGKELPVWSRPCFITVKVARRAGGAGGATTFEFSDGKVVKQTMELEGSLERILASALPHEVTHAVLAHAFGSRVPRWVDEGAAVLAEGDQERQRHENALLQAHDAGHLLPLRRLFEMQEFPKDIGGFYAQGYSVTRFLVQKQGCSTVIKFVRQGSQEGWDTAAKTHYGYGNIAELEKAWVADQGFAEREKATGDLHARLEQAFGKDCKEIQAKIKVELRWRRMIFATNQMSLEPDGRIRLTPCSIAYFGERLDAKLDEMTAIRTSAATFTFDRPIRSMADIGQATVIAVDLPGNVRIVSQPVKVKADQLR
jgi:RNA polymerase sigma factor (sigma-70 family)